MESRKDSNRITFLTIIVVLLVLVTAYQSYQISEHKDHADIRWERELFADLELQSNIDAVKTLYSDHYWQHHTNYPGNK